VEKNSKTLFPFLSDFYTIPIKGEQNQVVIKGACMHGASLNFISAKLDLSRLSTNV